jgi:putative membrane protein
MTLFKEALSLLRQEAALFRRFPRLWGAVLGILCIPSLYAYIYLVSVWDPTSRTHQLPALIVNHDRGVTFRGQNVNLGRELVQELQDGHAFGFTVQADELEARRWIREGRALFTVIIPSDFSERAVPGADPEGGRLRVFASEGNNYAGAGFARHFAGELGHRLNEKLNEKRWALVLGETAGAGQSLQRLRDGVIDLRASAGQLARGLRQADRGGDQLAQGQDQLQVGVGQLTDGVRQMGDALSALEDRLPSTPDLHRLKTGASQLDGGHSQLARGLGELHAGVQTLTDAAYKLQDETESIPLVGGRVSAGVERLASGGAQLSEGVRTLQQGQAKLADATEQVATGVAALADGTQALQAGVSGMVSRLPVDARLDEIRRSAQAVAQGGRALQGGLHQLSQGADRLAAGLELMEGKLPTGVFTPGGSPKGLAASVQPDIEIDAPVANNGTGFVPNFVPLALWMGVVMTAFVFHLRHLPANARGLSPVAQLAGKMAVPSAIVVAQALLVAAMLAFALDIRVAHWPGVVLSMALASLTFMFIILAFTRAFGDTGKALALILLIVQLSSAGGILPIELSGSFFQQLSPWMPFTWVVKSLRASLFGAYDNAWVSAWLVVLATAFVALVLATWVGRWTYVEGDAHRPALDV